KSFRKAVQMPFTNPGSLIIMAGQQRGESLLGIIKYHIRPVGLKTIFMTEFPRQQGGSAGSANRVGNKEIVKSGSFICNAVNIGCYSELTPIGTHCLICMIIRQDKNDIRAF